MVVSRFGTRLHRPATKADAASRDDAAVRQKHDSAALAAGVQHGDIAAHGQVEEMNAIAAGAGKQTTIGAKADVPDSVLRGERRVQNAAFGGAGNLPDLKPRAIKGPRQKTTVPAELNFASTVPVEELLPGNRVPETQNVVPALAGQQVARMIQSDSVDNDRTCFERGLLSPRSRVPYVNALLCSQYQKCSVAIPRHLPGLRQRARHVA